MLTATKQEPRKRNPPCRAPHGNEDMEATHCASRGWTISAIARHLGRDRKTVRGYINGTNARRPGEEGAGPARAVHQIPGGPVQTTSHVWVSALYDEVSALGFR